MNDINWSERNQSLLEFESSLREKIHNEIAEYADFARQRGLSTYFTSGLDVAAGIALTGANKEM